MAKKYICTGYGIDRDTGAMYYTVAPIFEGTTRQGTPFGMIQSDQRMSVDEEMQIGEIKSFSLKAD